MVHKTRKLKNDDVEDDYDNENDDGDDDDDDDGDGAGVENIEAAQICRAVHL